VGQERGLAPAPLSVSDCLPGAAGRVVAVRVPLADRPVLVMDHMLGVVLLSPNSPCRNRLLFSWHARHRMRRRSGLSEEKARERSCDKATYHGLSISLPESDGRDVPRRSTGPEVFATRIGGMCFAWTNNVLSRP
jgi:hypothetical protein